MIASASNANITQVAAVLYSAEADNDHTFQGDSSTVNSWFWEAYMRAADNFGDFYKGTLQDSPTISQQLSDLYYGVEQSSSITLRFSNGEIKIDDTKARS